MSLEQPARPTLPERPCPVCGKSLDPLRAGAVMLFEDGFRFLCDADCRRRFVEGERDHDAAREQPRPTPSRPRRKVSPPKVRTRSGSSSSPDRSAAWLALSAPKPPPPWMGLGAAGLGLLLAAFAFNPIVAIVSAFAIGGAAAAGLVLGWSSRREVGWLGWALPPTGAILAAIAALLARTPRDDARLWLVGAAFAAAAVVVRAWLDAQANEPVARVVALLLAKMPSHARVPTKAADWATEVESEHVAAASVRAGQEILVGEGEVVAVDGVVQAGEAFALLHPAARTPARREAGDPILAGAQVVEGEIRVLATRVGEERALVRPTSFGEPRAGRSASLTLLATRATRWGGLAALAGAAASLLVTTDEGVAVQLAAAAAVMLAAPLVAIRRVSEAPYVAAAATAAERGIAFANARALDRAGRVTVAALCTHGTITEGEPEVVEIHPVGSDPWQPLVALVAGAESAAEAHPIALAVLRFCERRDITPSPVRRAAFVPGRGVTAVSPTGEELVVGNRALLLEEGVSVAVADADATRAEERGHTVVFAGLDGRVKAVISLRDEDRLGARAAVQRLIDLGIEVVLISGDHRGTVEALAKHLDITHVKAELLPNEQGAEVKRLRETGGVVCTVGRPGHDDAALGAADVPVVLGAAGSPDGERAISLTGEDVRDAAAALWLAHAARRAAWRGTVFSAIAGGVLVTLAATGIAVPAVAALLALGIDAFALPSAARLLRRIELRLPERG